MTYYDKLKGRFWTSNLKMMKLYCKTCKDYVNIRKEQRIPAVGKDANKIYDIYSNCKRKINSFVDSDWIVTEHNENE